MSQNSVAPRVVTVAIKLCAYPPCGKQLEPGANPRRRTCSDSHRVLLSQAQKEAKTTLESPPAQPKAAEAGADPASNATGNPFASVAALKAVAAEQYQRQQAEVARRNSEAYQSAVSIQDELTHALNVGRALVASAGDNKEGVASLGAYVKVLDTIIKAASFLSEERRQQAAEADSGPRIDQEWRVYMEQHPDALEAFARWRATR